MKLLDGPIEIAPPAGLSAEPFSFGKLMKLMACFGPAAIAASVSIGAGETLISVVTGAWAQYQLLWLVLLACLCKGLVTTYLLGRYTAITGEYIGHRLARLPGPRGWLLVLLIVTELGVAGPICAVVARPCGNLLTFLLMDYLPGERDAANVLTDESMRFWELSLAVTFIVLAVGMSLKNSYERLEKQNLVICAMLVGGTVLASLLVRPNISEAIRGTFMPQLPLTPWTTIDPITAQSVPTPPSAGAYDFAYLLMIVTVFGYVGNTVFGYIVYSNWVGVRRWGLTSHPQIEQIRRHLAAGGGYEYLPRDQQQVARVWRGLAPLRWDVGMGALVLLVVSASFMITGAQVIYPRVPQNGLPEWNTLLTEQRHVWQEIHPWLVPVYYVCILAALWGTLNALPEIWSRVTHEFLAAISPRAERWPYRRFQQVLVLLVLLPTLFLLITGVQLQLMAAIVATFTTNLAVAIVCAVGLYLNWTLPLPYRPRWYWLAGSTLAVTVLSAAAVGGLCGLAQRL